MRRKLTATTFVGLAIAAAAFARERESPLPEAEQVKTVSIKFDHPKHDHRAMFGRQRFDSLMHEPGALVGFDAALLFDRRFGRGMVFVPWFEGQFRNQAAQHLRRLSESRRLRVSLWSHD